MAKKIDPNDKDLLLTNEKVAEIENKKPIPKETGFNKKRIYMFLGIIGIIFIVGAAIGLSPPENKDTTEEEKEIFSPLPMGELAITESDYASNKKVEMNTTPVAVTRGEADVVDGRYRVYDRREEPKQEAPVIVRNNPVGGSSRRIEDQEDLADRMASFYFEGDPLAGSGLTRDQDTPGINVNQQQRESTWETQNAQDAKNAFLNSRKLDVNGYLDSYFTESFDPARELKAGTVVRMALITELNSDLPGPVKAQVLQDIRNTATKQNILIPRGTIVEGVYDSKISFGQDRLLIRWDRLIRPDGGSLDLQGQIAVDQSGRAGLADKVDYHLGETAGSLIMTSAFDIAMDSTVSYLNSITNNVTSVLTNKGEAAKEIGAALAEKYLNRQPTITISSGTITFLYLQKDVILPIYGDDF